MLASSLQVDYSQWQVRILGWARDVRGRLCIHGGEAIGLFLCVVFLGVGKRHSVGICGLHACQLVFESELESKVPEEGGTERLDTAYHEHRYGVEL